MTTTEFLKACEDYFGRWQRTTVRVAVFEFLERRTPEYREVLWPLLRDGRNMTYGAPDIKALTDLHVEACDILELREADRQRKVPPARMQIEGPRGTRHPITQEQIDSWPTEEDAPGDRWLSHEEAHEALGVVYGRLKAKDDERRAEEKAGRR